MTIDIYSRVVVALRVTPRMCYFPLSPTSIRVTYGILERQEEGWRIGGVVAHIQPRYADGYVDWYMAAIICEIDNGYLRAPPEGKRGHQMHICPLDSRLPSRMRSLYSFVLLLSLFPCLLLVFSFLFFFCMCVLEKWFYGWCLYSYTCMHVGLVLFI